MSEQPTNKFPKNLLDDPKMRLSAPPPKGAEKPATLQPTFNPASGDGGLIVRTQVEQDDKNGFARAGIGFKEFNAMLEGILDVVDNKISGFTFECDTGKPAERVLDARIKVAREADAQGGSEYAGSIYIALLKKGVTPVKFYFNMSSYHRFVGLDGKEIDNAMRSNLVARGWVNSIRQAMTNLVGGYKERVYDFGDNGKGGNSYGKGNGGGYQKQGGYRNNDNGPDASASVESSGSFDSFADEFLM